MLLWFNYMLLLVTQDKLICKILNGSSKFVYMSSTPFIHFASLLDVLEDNLLIF